jgi:hypothetical protein
MKSLKIILVTAIIIIAYLSLYIYIDNGLDKNIKERLISKQKLIDSLSKPILQQEKEWDLFIKAIGFVESSWNDFAVNESSGASGYLQLTEIYVDQINFWGYNYSYEDRFNRNKSIEMFEITNKILNPERDFHLALVIHNPNGGLVYHNSVMEKYKELCIK